MNLDIPLQRLNNQLLLSPERLTSPTDVVHWIGAIQSQDYAGAKWAIGLRTHGLTDIDLDHVFANGSILRTHVLRPTWHFVAPFDIRWMLALTAPLIRTKISYMDRQLGLDQATLKKSNMVLVKSLRDGNSLTRAELGTQLEKNGVHTNGQQLGNIMMHAELDALLCSGPRRGKQFTYALLDERAPSTKEWTRDESLAELTTRYFQSHGPATLHDFCIWSGLKMADARQGIELVRTTFVCKDIDGQTYWFKETNLPVRKRTPTAYLLPNFDEYFIGFKDRSVITRTARQSGIQKNDPALLANVIILDGQVIGGWRRILKKNEVHVEANLLIQPTDSEEHAIVKATNALGRFLNVPVKLNFAPIQNKNRKTRNF